MRWKTHGYGVGRTAQGSGRRERLITEYAGDSSERFPAVLRDEKEMLVLSRHEGEKFMIGDDILVEVVRIQGDRVRIGITAPGNVSVHRAEIYRLIQKRLREAESEHDTT